MRIEVTLNDEKKPVGSRELPCSVEDATYSLALLSAARVVRELELGKLPEGVTKITIEVER